MRRMAPGSKGWHQGNLSPERRGIRGRKIRPMAPRVRGGVCAGQWPSTAINRHPSWVRPSTRHRLQRRWRRAFSWAMACWRIPLQSAGVNSFSALCSPSRSSATRHSSALGFLSARINLRTFAVTAVPAGRDLPVDDLLERPREGNVHHLHRRDLLKALNHPHAPFGRVRVALSVERRMDQAGTRFGVGFAGLATV